MKVLKLNEKVESTKFILDEDLLIEGPIDNIKQALGNPTDPQAKTAKAFKRAAAKTQRADAKNTLAMHKRIGQEAGPTYKQYKWYIPKENGGYETTPKTQEEIIAMFTPEGQAPEELINAMVVTPNGYISRIGMQKIDAPIRFDAAKHLKNDSTPVSTPENGKTETNKTAESEVATKNPTAASQDAPAQSDTQQATDPDVNKNTPTDASIANISDKIMEKFRALDKLTGLQVIDGMGKAVTDTSIITKDSAPTYKVIVDNVKFKLTDFLKAAMKQGFLKEELARVPLFESLLTEAPNLIFTDDELNNPDSIDFKKIIKDRTDKEESEKAAEAKRIRKAELHNKHADIIDKIETSIGSGKDMVETLDMLHDELVPPQGEAETVAGEIVRAMMRLLSRSYNDGDKFYSGYGLETCGGSAEYLYDMDSSFSEFLQHIVDEAYRIDSDDDLYDEMLKDLTKLVVEYIMENPEVLEEENDEDSREYKSREWDLEAEQPRYEFEIMGNADVEQLVEEGIIDAWALNSYVESALEYESWYNNDAEIERPWSHNSTTVTLSNLTKDALEALSDMFRDDERIDRFWDDLVSEHEGEMNSTDLDDLEDENFDDEE